ncbi:MAG: ferrochelatase [Gammaproteobacteria bacterium]
MAGYLGSEGYEHGTQERLGILLANLGTPEAPEAAPLRRYLAEFLWDPRVIEVPRPLWWLILNGVILRTRPRQSAEAYRKVWTAEGSPLLTISREQAAGFETALGRILPGPAKVALGMRYGKPSIFEALEALRAANCRRLLVLPLYPQYSGSTTASTFDAVAAALARWRWVPELRFINHYHDEPGYISALASSLREHWEARGRSEHLVMSFHGVPKRYLLSGDPYHCHCHKTARLLAAELDLADDDWSLSFQSRVGREEWLRPYTDEHIKALGAGGTRTLDVICPGFSADCLETLEEIAQQNAEFFAEAGGERLTYVPALNAREDHLAFLASLAARHLQGWPEADPAFSAETRAAGLRRSREQALALGGGAR